MRLILLSIALLLVCGSASAEVSINMDRIMQIESGGNTMAHNKRSGARGLYQITPVCLADYNQRQTPKYIMNDMFDPQKNGRVAYWYINTRIPDLLRHYGYSDTVTNRLIAYNAGVGALKRKIMPSETRAYIVKYHRGIK